MNKSGYFQIRQVPLLHTKAKSLLRARASDEDLKDCELYRRDGLLPHVLQLEIAMNETEIMRVLQAVHQLHRDEAGLEFRDSDAPVDELQQVAVLCELHHEVGVARLKVLVSRNDVLMVEVARKNLAFVSVVVQLMRGRAGLATRLNSVRDLGLPVNGFQHYAVCTAANHLGVYVIFSLQLLDRKERPKRRGIRRVMTRKWSGRGGRLKARCALVGHFSQQNAGAKLAPTGNEKDRR